MTALFAALALGLTAPRPIDAERMTVEAVALPFDPAAWPASAKVEMKVEEDGKPVVYRGVPLARLLGDRAGGEGRAQMSALRALADAVLLVHAPDDYQAAVSAAAVAMDPTGKRYLLATERDGRPLADGQGPVKLLIPDDPMHVRWVRQVDSVRLLTIPRAKR
jgi:hypothetical protein